MPWYTCTATATTLEQQAIINCLHLPNTVQVRGILYREEISIDFHHYTQPVKPQRAVTLLNLVVPLIRGKTLIYFNNIEKCPNMVNMLKNKEFKVASFTAATPSSACETIFKDLAQGHIDMVCCTAALEMGWNVPDLQTLIFTSVPSFITQLIQLLGCLARGTSYRW